MMLEIICDFDEIIIGPRDGAEMLNNALVRGLSGLDVQC